MESFDLHRFLQRLAAARGGVATVLLTLPDGRVIACRDAAQAHLIAALWRAFVAPLGWPSLPITPPGGVPIIPSATDEPEP